LEQPWVWIWKRRQAFESKDFGVVVLVKQHLALAHSTRLRYHFGLIILNLVDSLKGRQNDAHQGVFTLL
jgi:hypothetical protein